MNSSARTLLRGGDNRPGGTAADHGRMQGIAMDITEKLLLLITGRKSAEAK